jgi:hypothetical protein
MYLVILILVLVNFFTSTGWLDLLNKIFKPTYDLLHFIIPLTIVTSLLFVLVPIWFPNIIVAWILGCLAYLVVGFLLVCFPNEEEE